jgi:hypothetical protein
VCARSAAATSLSTPNFSAPAKADNRCGRHTDTAADAVARAACATAGGGAAAAAEMGPLLPLGVHAGGAAAAPAAAAARLARAAGSGQCTAVLKTGGRCTAPAKADHRRGRHARKAAVVDAVARVGAGATGAVAGGAAARGEVATCGRLAR